MARYISGKYPKELHEKIRKMQEQLRRKGVNATFIDSARFVALQINVDEAVDFYDDKTGRRKRGKRFTFKI